MKNLIIIGAGGYGREIYNFAKESLGYQEEFLIKGFLDDNLNVMDNFKGYPPVLATVNEYVPQKNDIFVCAIGTVSAKKKVCEIMLSKGAQFYTLISKDAYIGMNNQIGIGCIICPTARVHCDNTIGDFVTIQPFCAVGHDCKIGNWCHLNDYADCGGSSVLEDEVTIHTQSFVLPGRKIGKGSTVGAGSVVIKNVPENVVVLGNPAKPLPLPKKN